MASKSCRIIKKYSVLYLSCILQQLGDIFINPRGMQEVLQKFRTYKAPRDVS